MISQALIYLKICMLAAVLSACLPKENSSRLNVANGLEASKSEFPSVIKVSSGSSADAKSYSSCTATAVSAHTLLTAAHCIVADSGKAEGAVWINDESGKQIVAERKDIAIHPKYSAKGASMEGSFDIAAVTFSKPVFKYWVGVSTVSGQKADKITLVGFGITSVGGQDGGKKRYGTNTIKTLEGLPDKTGSRRAPDTIVLEDGVKDARDADKQGVDRGERVTNLQGDSGGPIFLKGAVLGVASTVAGSYGKVLNGNYVSTFRHQSWLKGLGFPMCNLTIECEALPKTDLEVKNQNKNGDTSEPAKPPVVTKDYDVYAAVDGESNPTLKINATAPVDSVEVCLGATKELSIACSSKKAVVRSGDFYSVDLGPQSQVLYVSVLTAKGKELQSQLVKLSPR